VQQRRVVLQPLDEALCLVDQPFVLGRRQTVKQRLEQACPQGMRQLLPLLRPRLGEESLIATEQLVAAVARERYRDLSAGMPRDEIGREDRAVAKRIVHIVHELVEQVDNTRRDDLEIVRHAEVPRHPLLPLQLVIGGISKPMLKVCAAPMCATTSELSTPPEGKAPSGTSLTHGAADRGVGARRPFVVRACRLWRAERHVPVGALAPAPGCQVDLEQVAGLELAHVLK